MLEWKTDSLYPDDPALQEWIYNGLDSCVTLEVLEAIEPQLDNITEKVYDFSRQLMAPILEMNLRGMLIDKQAFGQELDLQFKNMRRLQANLNRLLTEGLGLPPLNPSSPKQMKDLFYVYFGLPPHRQKGIITTNRKALEKFRSYFHIELIVNHILAIRDCAKKIGVLRTPIDPDGRMRTNYNIGGTTTGRLSSAGNAFRTGTNLQNITGTLRRGFIADPGMKLGSIDLEQAESRAVGAICWNLFCDPKYLDFCESGDLHTNVCKMTWPHLPWINDPAADKKIAKRIFVRDFSYRDTAKRVGHASNYGGKDAHIASETRVPKPLITEFQRNYFKTFSSLTEWHKHVRNKLYRDGWITTFMGRRRYFFGRRWADDTVRSAIAYEPQSAIADYINRGLLAVWRDGCCQLLLQVHDAIVFQYPEHLEHEVIPRVLSLLEIEVPLMHGRVLKIPGEAFVGWNWAYAKDQTGKVANPDGLVPYDGQDKRKRSPQTGVMDRYLS